MPSPHRPFSAIRTGLTAGLAATMIAVGFVGSAAADPVPAANAASASGRPDRQLPPTAAVPAGDVSGRKIG